MNKTERMKATKNGLDVLDDIHRYARLGYQMISDEDAERLKWHGVFYRKQTPGFFMMRLRIPGGILRSPQLQEIGEITNLYCRGEAQITTRQQIQLRWLRIEDIPIVLERLESVGVSTRQTGHDNVRNVVACPLAGISPNEIIDSAPIAKQISQLITGSRDFSYLPRKFNIALTGCTTNGSHTELNDIGLTPAELDADDDALVGFNVKVGGAMGSQTPQLAQPLDAFVTIDEAVPLCRAILEMYRDHGFRKGRNGARLKFLIAEWGIDRFRAEVERYAGKPLRRAGVDLIKKVRYDYVGVHEQRQEGYSYVGCMVPVGRISGDQMRDAARLADVYGIGELRFTVNQDLLFPYVHRTQLASLLEEPLLVSLPPQPDPLLRGVVSCTGAEFCHLAVIETKDRALELVMELNRRLVLKETVRVYWSGCPNACGQHHVGDIGLQGAKARIGGTMIDAVDIFVGGQLGLSPRLAERVAAKVPCVDLPDTLAELIRRHFPERLRLSADDPTAHVAAVDAAEPDLIQPSGIMPLAVPADEARSVQFEDADGEVRTTTLPTGAILLHRSLDQGIKSSYDCMTGTCGTCRVRIVAGGECLSPPTPAEVELLGDDLTAGYRLACQATRVGKPAESAPSRAVGSETPAI